MLRFLRCLLPLPQIASIPEASQQPVQPFHGLRLYFPESKISKTLKIKILHKTCKKSNEIDKLGSCYI